MITNAEEVFLCDTGAKEEDTVSFFTSHKNKMVYKGTTSDRTFYVVARDYRYEFKATEIIGNLQSCDYIMFMFAEEE